MPALAFLPRCLQAGGGSGSAGGGSPPGWAGACRGSEPSVHWWLQSRFWVGMGLERMQLLSQIVISSSQRPNIFWLNRRSVLVFYLLSKVTAQKSRSKGPLRRAFLNDTLTPPPESTRVYRRQPWSKIPDKEAHFPFRLDWMWQEN